MATLVFLLNPVVAPFWISRVTSAPIYWRAFYVLPIVAMIGAAVIALLERLPGTRPWAEGRSLVSCWPFACSQRAARVHLHLPTWGEIGWPAYKLVEEAVDVSRAVIANAPPGVMLASREISGTTPMLRGGYPQLRIRDNTLVEWLTARDRPGDADRRICASSSPLGAVQCRDEFEILVTSTDALSTIVLRSDVYPSVEPLLDRLGFVHRISAHGHEIVWR